MVCDYTGIDMSWSPSPLRISLKAIYPFAVVEGRCLYHTRTNVCSITVALNLLKRKHPTLVLPLLGHYLRVSGLEVLLQQFGMNFTVGI